MVITDQFVYIHMPKTGGTFVTELLKRLYSYAPSRNFGPGLIGKIGRRLFDRTRIKIIHKHGFCSAIPKQFTGLPIAGCVRNPYDRYVSQYEFKWWLNYPDRHPGVRDHPSFPELSFEEYVHLANERWVSRDNPGLRVEPSVGWHTAQFINWYCKDAASLLTDAVGARLSAEKVQANLYAGKFLRTGSLNRDLFEYLRAFGFRDSQLDYILHSDKIFPVEGGRSAGQNWQKYYSAELKNFVRSRERVLFDIFPEFDV